MKNMATAEARRGISIDKRKDRESSAQAKK